MDFKKLAKAALALSEERLAEMLKTGKYKEVAAAFMPYPRIPEKLQERCGSQQKAARIYSLIL